MAKVFTIKREYPKLVRILQGAAPALVSRRQAYGSKQKYDTNREIKYWSTWFLLKALTSSGFIQDWTDQKKYILDWVQMGVKTFRKHLAWLEDQKLLLRDSESPESFRLISFEEAADVLSIDYAGTYQVSFNPKRIKNGKQPFQYLLRTEEIEFHKRRQVDAIMKKLEKNPVLKRDVIYHIGQLGADYERLHSDDTYFVSRLLVLQSKLFREGSAFFTYMMECRADVNRGVIRIKQHHGYKSKQSVSYFKKKMVKFGFARIDKKATESTERCRLYVPANEETPKRKIRRDGLVDGYIYDRDRGLTIWRLCDQISRKYEIKFPKLYKKNNANAA